MKIYEIEYSWKSPPSLITGSRTHGNTEIKLLAKDLQEAMDYIKNGKAEIEIVKSIKDLGTVIIPDIYLLNKI